MEAVAQGCSIKKKINIQRKIHKLTGEMWKSSTEFCETFWNRFFAEHLRATVSGLVLFYISKQNSQLNLVFYVLFEHVRLHATFYRYINVKNSLLPSSLYSSFRVEFEKPPSEKSISFFSYHTF